MPARRAERVKASLNKGGWLVRHIALVPIAQDLVSFVFNYSMPQELIQVMSSLPLELSSRKMGMNARNSYQIKSSNPASSQQQTEVVSPAPNSVLASTPTPTIEELVRFKKKKKKKNIQISLTIPPLPTPKSIT